MSAFARPVTTTDLLKFAGLAFVVIDHFGAYFVDDPTGWRLLGRLAAPIFFFLIGFGRTRAVPWSWLVLGALLTLTDYIEAESVEDTTLNILLNFALLRWALLPAVERWVMPSPWRIAGVVAIGVALISSTDHVLEYGTGGWLWALFGLAHRRALEDPSGSRWTGIAIAGAVGIAYALRESDDLDFDVAEAALLFGLLAGLVVLLARFRRADLASQPPRPIAGVLGLCGRYSLEIYAVSLLLMQAVAYGMETTDPDGEGT